MAIEKQYFEIGDILSVRIPETKEENLLFFKNPILIRGQISSGDFFLEISTPVTKADMERIIEALKQVFDKDLSGQRKILENT